MQEHLAFLTFEEFQNIAARTIAVGLSVQPTVAVVTAAVCGVLAALTAQYAYDNAKSGEVPRYFGGRPVEEHWARDEKATRADGARERANARAAFFQTLMTPLLIITALFGLCASVPTLIVDGVVIVALGIVLKIFLPQWQSWKRDDKNLKAKTEYYVFYQSHKHGFTNEEREMLFAKEHPRFASWLNKTNDEKKPT